MHFYNTQTLIQIQEHVSQIQEQIYKNSIITSLFFTSQYTPANSSTANCNSNVF